MRKTNLAIAIATGAVLLSGCKLEKMIKLAQENDLQVSPNPLEVHGGNIPFEVSAVLPPKMLPPNTSFTLNTIYQYGDQEVDAGSVVLTADDFPNSATTTSRKSETFTLPYVEGMNPGTLYVQGVATDIKKDKSKTTDRLTVAKGLVLTSQWVQNVAFSSYADHGYDEREELVPTSVDFYFDQGKSNLRTTLSYDGTSNRTKGDELSAFIAEKNVTRTVTITGAHSPEGTETINSELSANRVKTIETYYRGRMDRYDYKGVADSIEFILKPIVQDWNALRTALDDYDGIDDSEKSQYTNVINGSGSFEEKEKELRKLASYKKVFDDIYPGLRSAKTEVLTVKPKKSNAEIALLAKAIASGDASMDAPAKSMDAPAKSMDAPAKSMDAQVKSMDDQVKSMDTLSTSMDTLSTSMDAPAKSMDDLAKSMDDLAKSMDDPAKSMDAPAKSMDDQAKSMDDQAKSMDDQAKSMDAPAKSMDAPAKSMDDQAKSMDDQAKSMDTPATSVDTLSNEELMFSATLTPSLDEKVAIYKVATAKIGSWQAHNNLGATYLEMSKLDDATIQLEIAAKKNSNSAVVQANLAAVQALQQEYEKAYATLGNVSGATNDVSSKVNAMKGAIEVRMAKYDKAKASFASAKLDDAANIDKGLAYLLSGEYAQATGAFGQVSPDGDFAGIVAYLLAVSAARGNDAPGVGSNLKKAVDADPSLKDKALNDLEFANFADATNEAVK